MGNADLHLTSFLLLYKCNKYYLGVSYVRSFFKNFVVFLNFLKQSKYAVDSNISAIIFLANEPEIAANGYCVSIDVL